MSISTNVVMVVLGAKLNPVIMQLWNSLHPQQPAWMAAWEGERHFGKESRRWRQTGLRSHSRAVTSGHVT